MLTYILFLLFLLPQDATNVFTVGDLQLTFKDVSIDLGTVKKGDKRSFEYEFTNTGTIDISISIVSGCDCTTTDWPRLPIKPGETAIIPVTFDSTEKEESETVDVDVYLDNLHPETGNQIFTILNYTFVLDE